MDCHGPGTRLLVCIYLLIYVWIYVWLIYIWIFTHNWIFLGYWKSVGPQPPSYLWWEIWCLSLPPKSQRRLWSLPLCSASDFSRTPALTRVSFPMLLASAPLWLKHESSLCTTSPEPAYTKQRCIQQTVCIVGSKGQRHSRANDLKLNAGRSWPPQDLWPPQLTNSSLHTSALRQSSSPIKVTQSASVSRAVPLTEQEWVRGCGKGRTGRDEQSCP